MKPKYILSFLLFVFTILLLFSVLFPKDGIKITDGFVLHFPTLTEIFEDREGEVVDITEIVENNQVPENNTKNNLKTVVLSDSTSVLYESKEIVNSNEVSRKLEFPQGNKNVLNRFFTELHNLRTNGKLIRILHYGDSQIEADRMTSYIRYKLQGQFGGSGPGLVPAVQPFNYQSPVRVEMSETWKRYPGFGRKDTTVEHSRYGVLLSYSRFTPIIKNKDDSLNINNSSNLKENLDYSAWLKINHSKYSFSNVKKYYQCRMFYGYNSKPVDLNIYSGENLLSKDILSPADYLQIKAWQFNSTPPYLKMEFTGKDSPDIYALALDGRRGIAVDNIALRGSSGTVFSSNDTKLLGAIYRNLNVKLVILQFGGNITPYIKENYKFYENSFYRQLSKIKRLIPGVSIIVIGPADMSKKEKDQYVSYPNIGMIRDALKKATFKANCAFWDMYEAMGGNNSMPSWVFSEPPLAEKDFTHFTVKGSRIIAQMFYKALMFEYGKFSNKKSTKSKKKDEIAVIR